MNDFKDKIDAILDNYVATWGEGAKSDAWLEGHTEALNAIIAACLEALPEKMTNTKEESDSDYWYGVGNNQAIDIARANFSEAGRSRKDSDD